MGHICTRHLDARGSSKTFSKGDKMRNVKLWLVLLVITQLFCAEEENRLVVLATPSAVATTLNPEDVVVTRKRGGSNLSLQSTGSGRSRKEQCAECCCQCCGKGIIFNCCVVFGYIADCCGFVKRNTCGRCCSERDEN